VYAHAVVRVSCIMDVYLCKYLMRCDGGLACAFIGKFLCIYIHIQVYMCTYICACVCSACVLVGILYIVQAYSHTPTLWKCVMRREGGLACAS